MVDDQRPVIQRITIQVQLPGKEQPIQYILAGPQVQQFCGIGWRVPNSNDRNLLEYVSGLPESDPKNSTEKVHGKWGTHHSPLPAFLLKLPDCDCSTPYEVWGF